MCRQSLQGGRRVGSLWELHSPSLPRPTSTRSTAQPDHHNERSASVSSDPKQFIDIRSQPGSSSASCPEALVAPSSEAQSIDTTTTAPATHKASEKSNRSSYEASHDELPLPQKPRGSCCNDRAPTIRVSGSLRRRRDAAAQGARREGFWRTRRKTADAAAEGAARPHRLVHTCVMALSFIFGSG